MTAPFLVDNRNLFFLQKTVGRLNRWLWDDESVRSTESRLFTPRGRHLSALKRVVAEAAEGEGPQRPAASVGWVNQVFATVTVAHGWSLLFRDGLQTDFITFDPLYGRDRLPPLSISTGLFVALLIEVWEWVLGREAGPPAEKDAPLCHVRCEPDTARVRLKFSPRGKPVTTPGLSELVEMSPAADISAEFAEGNLLIEIRTVQVPERKPMHTDF